MAAAHSARRTSGPILRSISPSARLSRQFSAHASTVPFASAASSVFGTARSLQRPHSPPRRNLYNYTSPSHSLSMDRPRSPNRSISMARRVENPPAATRPKRTCMCSPTNHPGSFRCSLHKTGSDRASNNSQTASYGSSSRLNMRRSAMKNSLVRIGTVEGDLVKRALAALIRPSSHQQRRRGEFQPRRSRLSVMSKA